MSNDLLAMLQQLQQAEQQRAESNESGADFFKLSDSPDYLKFEIGQSYKFRILWATDSDVGRNTPFINKVEHKYYDDKDGKVTFDSVTCRTSEYIDDKAGYNKCRVCAATSDMYEKKADPVQMKMYTTFRRQINCYALVYVTEDSRTPSNVGTVKIIRYGKTIRAEFKKAIFGINEKALRGTSPIGTPTVGIQAIALENGFDCHIEVTSVKEGSKTWPKYSIDFARNATTIPITQEQVNAEAKRVRFDDLYTISSIEEIEKFYTKYILHYTDKESDVKSMPAFQMVEQPELAKPAVPIRVGTPAPVESPVISVPPTVKVEDTPEVAPAATPAAEPAAAAVPDVQAILNRINKK